MSDNAASTNSTSPPHHTTITQIKSPFWLWAGRVVFSVFLILGVIYILQITQVAWTYFQAQAQTELAEAGTLAGLYVWGEVIIRLLLHMIFVLTGLLIFWRRSQDRVGLMAALFLVTFGAGGPVFYQYLPDATAFTNQRSIAWGYYLFAGPGWALFFIFLMLFPDGRFVPRWMIYHLVVALATVGLWALPTDTALHPVNWSPIVLVLMLLALFGLALWAQVYRYRHVSTPAQRQQTKWVLYGLGLMLLISIGAYTIRALFPEVFAAGSVEYHVLFLVNDIAFVFLPLSLLISIMRSRLWDVDLVINRSLVYGGVAVVVALIFAGMLFGVQLVVGQTQPLIALLISAALSAALFRPLRNGIQHLVDRYVYRLRFDLNELQQAQKGPTIQNPGALTGRRLGSYEVLDLIGRGGMGEVYKAVRDGQVVAIKTLRTENTAEKELVQRFQREAETGMALDHPNIARVHAIDSQDGLIYMVMDYLGGQDLSQMLKDKGRLDGETVTEVVTDLAEALAAAHAQGLVHRDIKPSNVMLVRNDDHETYRAVLMDFGVTKMKNANTLTGTGAIGTIDYMAPEQIINAREVDARADIYSLGIMMYEMLTGEKPFKGSAGQVLFAHIQQPAPDPRDMDDSIPRPLAKAVLKALEKDPDKRFQSVRELAAALA